MGHMAIAVSLDYILFSRTISSEAMTASGIMTKCNPRTFEDEFM